MMQEQKKKYGYLEGALSVVVNIGLFSLKLWIGLAVGSVAMIADAWHTLSDTFTSGVVLLGFWFSAKPKDKEHPFGHGRSEIIGAMIIGILLGLVGINFIKESYAQLRGAQSVHFGQIGIIIFIISAVIKEGLAQFSIWAGKKIKSESLIADGWHHRTDALASALIVIGALLGRYFWWIDGVMGIIVSLLIIYTAYEIIKKTSNSLMGECAEDAFVGRISNLIQPIAPDITDIHHVHIHRYGDHNEVTVHLRMPAHFTLGHAHELVTKAEERLRKELHIEPTIHFEPQIKNVSRRNK